MLSRSAFIKKLNKLTSHRVNQAQQTRAWRFYQQTGGRWPHYITKPPGPPIIPGQAYQSNDNYLLYNHSVLVEDLASGRPVAYFLKGLITDPGLIQAGRNLKRYIQKTNQRRMAAGLGAKYKSGQVGRPVYSSIVGYADKSNFHPCRMTTLYKRHREMFDTETLPLLQFISTQFKKWCPEQYADQQSFVDSINQHMVLPGTCYTTITVNMDFRTHAHQDRGDYDSGLGNLAVFRVPGSPGFSGGEFLLPEYQIGFQIEEGDLLFVDVHQLHCNNPIKGRGRLSLVCYARQNIGRYCQGLSRSNIEKWQSYRHRQKPK